MPSTRSSARQAESNTSPQAEDNNKRKAEDSQTSPSKRGRKDAEKGQKTLEETLGTDQKTLEDAIDTDEKEIQKDIDTDMKDSKDIQKPGESFEGDTKEGESKDDPEKALKDSRGGPGLNALGDNKPQAEGVPHDDVHASDAAKDDTAKDDTSKDDTSKDDTSKADTSKDDTAKDDAPKGDSETAEDSKAASEGGAVSEDKDRKDAMPSNILEKGIIYFFTRGRVGIDEPADVQDLQRSFFVLRPLPKGAKLGDGSIEDVKNNRLIALPKKVFPKSPADKFMVFVEKSKVAIDELKTEFFQGSEYQTKTAGARTQPPITPIGEGVYAITATGARSESHLAYMLTIPQSPGEMQDDLGIREKGSFVMSLKNPTVKGPSYATLDQGPEFPQDIIDEFNNRSWMPAQPKHLDYPNAQFLLIGEAMDESHALEATKKDEKDDAKETPKEEIEKLEHEDELRVEHLKGDDTVFEDLGLSHKEYPSVPTTW